MGSHDPGMPGRFPGSRNGYITGVGPVVLGPVMATLQGWSQGIPGGSRGMPGRAPGMPGGAPGMPGRARKGAKGGKSEQSELGPATSRRTLGAAGANRQREIHEVPRSR